MKTRKGTPRAKIWDDDWMAVVEEKEAKLGRRICGAHTMADAPCEIASTHASGRCRFHGGFNLTGAPKGNRNAVLHGLYSRRLQVCGSHCPLWESCPFAGEDVMKLSPKLRPACAYETSQYSALLSDFTTLIENCTDPTVKHLIHDVAFLKVMMMRAGAALRNQQLIQTTTVSGKNYSLETSKSHAYLQAFTQIAKEYRHFQRLLNTTMVHMRPGVTKDSELGPARVKLKAHRLEHDTDLDPDAHIDIDITEDLRNDRVKAHIDDASQAALYGLHEDLLEALQKAHEIAPGFLSPHLEKEIMECYRVTFVREQLDENEEVLSPEALEEAVARMRAP